MKTARILGALILLSFFCVHGQTTIITTAPKDPEVKPEQRTAAIVHYEKIRATTRVTIRELAFDLQNAEGSSRTKLNEAINYQQDIVDWANWCIAALRDKTAAAKACVERTDLK